MTTFSQVVDDLAVEIVRPDMIIMLPAYLNQTIRELHFDSATKMPVYFNDNRQEDLITVSGYSDSNRIFLWDIPRSSQLQAIEAFYYDAWGVYAIQKAPAVNRLRNLSEVDAKYYWYRTGPSIAFHDTGANGSTIQAAWFEFPRALIYYPKANRPMTYDVEQQLYVNNPSYMPAPLSVDTSLLYSTNWILDRWSDMLKEGVRAKSYKRMGDDTRASRAYSLFETTKAGMITNESYDMTPLYNR